MFVPCNRLDIMKAARAGGFILVSAGNIDCHNILFCWNNNSLQGNDQLIWSCHWRSMPTPSTIHRSWAEERSTLILWPTALHIVVIHPWHKWEAVVTEKNILDKISLICDILMLFTHCTSKAIHVIYVSSELIFVIQMINAFTTKVRLMGLMGRSLT